MRILIVGAGIGGPTLAYWLRKTGHEPTLVERAPTPRSGGYVVDFWGAGFDVADRMGIVPELVDQGYRIEEVRDVAADGHRISSFDPEGLVGISGGRYVTIARADLAATILRTLDDAVETIYGDTPESIDDVGDHVEVRMQSGATREFDLVVGADGLHSFVRRHVFGTDDEFERHLGIAVAAFDIDDYQPRDERIAISHAGVGYQLLRLALPDGATVFLVTFRHEGALPLDNVEAQQEILRTSLAGASGELPGILARMPEARTFYFDTASQIRMPSWSRQRIALVGDAAAAPSLLAGQGSALAMVEAYVLAAELERAGDDHLAAFASYEQRLRGLVVSKQDAAIGLGTAFAPRNRLRLALRNTVMRTMSVPIIARMAMGRSLRDPIDLGPPLKG